MSLVIMTLHLGWFRIESIDGSAVAGEDYIAIEEIIVFAPDELEKQV